MALFEWTLILLLSSVVLTTLSKRIGAPYPVLLALAGAAVAFAPFGPEVRLDPELALALFIAPVLLDSAFDTSPRSLARNIKPLISLIVVAVALTTAAVAWVGHEYAGMSWAAAITLGAIVAPPDAGAAAAVLRGMHLPRRVRQIIEGESLLNDATALLIYRIAAGAALGSVTLANAAPQVAIALIGSPIVGYLAGRLYMLMGRRLEDPATLAVTSFVGTFGVWIIAERLGLSAIVTVVVYAITIARRANALMSPRNRISTYSVWETAIFTLNVLAFLIMGLQARTIIDRLAPNDIGSALAFSGAVLAAVIAVRVVYLITYVGLVQLKNRWFGVDLAPGLTPPTFKGGVLVSWSGMRGLVTLAAAFALPEGFPHRDLIVLSAFSVVLGTLVLQGLTLKPLVGLLKLPADDSVLREVSLARRRMLRAAIDALEDKSSKHAEMLRAGFIADLDVAENITAPQGATERDRLKLQAVQAQRRELVRLRQSGEIDDEAYHRLEEELDWAELEATPAGVYAPLTSTGE